MRMIYFTIFAATTAITCGCTGKMEPDDNPKDWAGTTFYHASEDEKQFTTYYKPYVGAVGDPMPFYDTVSGDFKIFYLQDYEVNQVGTYHPVWGVSTEDASSYVSLGEVLPCGGIDEQDAAIGTGSVVYDPENSLYYFYYTGNKYMPSSSESGQVVMRAVSEDSVNWDKDRNFHLKGEDDGYSKSDFRDPCIFRDDSGVWHMLVSTVQSSKGVLAEYVSRDLDEWTHQGVFMTMMWDRFYECPDVFKMGDWWYLVYSEKHVAIRKVQYFKAKTLDDLKLCTRNDVPLWPDEHEGYLDSRAFYAGKTASDGTDRYIWGWCPARPGEDNTDVGAEPEEPGWGGALVCHLLKQHEDGTLTCVAVPSLSGKYDTASKVKVMSGTASGIYDESSKTYSLSGDSYVLLNRLGTHNMIKFKVRTGNASSKFGFSLVRGDDSEKYYSIILNPEDGAENRKLNFEERGEEGIGFITGIDSYKFDTPEDGIYDITVITDNSVCVVYVNDYLAWTNRIYGISKNCWSLDCYEGDIQVSGLSVSRY